MVRFFAAPLHGALCGALIFFAVILSACATTPTTAPTNAVPTSALAAQATGSGTLSKAPLAAGSPLPGTVATPLVSVPVQATPQATLATLEPAAAIINGTTRISLATLNQAVKRRLDALKLGGDSPPADLKAFQDTVLDSLIQDALIAQAAQIQHVIVTDQDVENEIQDYIKSAGSRDKWLTQIAADQMTEAEYRAGLKSALITIKMRDIVTASVGTTAEQVHARHILVNDEATANQVVQQLKGGADFAALAAKLSLDVTTRQTGGDLGWFPRGQLLQKTVEDAAFSLPLNQYSAPVKSDLGYHIIETLERVKDRPIDPYTRSRLAEQVFETWLQALIKSAHIEKYPQS